MLSKGPTTPAFAPHDGGWSPVVLRGPLVAASTEVRIELGGASEVRRCLAIAEDGFVIESERPVPLRQLMRCRLRLPDGEDLELFAFAATPSRAGRQELKPMRMSGEVKDRWRALRERLGGGAAVARGTGETRPPRAGVYLSVERSRADWLLRLFRRGR